METHRFPFKWYLKDGYPKSNGLKVFSTFACGGGSTMGYKLAGFDVIGANGIDPKMERVYKVNHNPGIFVSGSISEMVKNPTEKLPPELFDLDVLDGSPPCSTFSIAGKREEGWKKEKKFKEGQSKQVLSDLFFDFIDLTEKLKPKVVIAENVKGMLQGNANLYTHEILKRFDKIGYNTQLFLLNSATMGVPQKRERVFFIGARKDLELPRLNLNMRFNERSTSFYEVGRLTDEKDEYRRELSPLEKRYYVEATRNKRGSVGRFKSNVRIRANQTCNTIIATPGLYHPTIPRLLSKQEVSMCSTFPLDYNFLDLDWWYIMGMSVPPVMMAQVAREVYIQWLNPLQPIVKEHG